MEYGYYTPYGYKGLINGEWILFVSDEEYYEYYKENFQ